MPEISVITVCYNSAATIATCIRSVIYQSLACEHVIVDGASCDTTMEIIAKFRNENMKIVSETDRGIYDAMNKGIALATGKIIGILNADDYFPSPNVLRNVVECMDGECVDSCYGNLVFVDPTDSALVRRRWIADAYHPEKFYRGWMPPHPTFFVRRSVYARIGRFRLDMESAADYELMLRFLLKERVSTHYIDKVLVHMRMGGVSNRSILNRWRANRMDRRAWTVNGLRPYPWTMFLKPLSKIAQFLVYDRTASLDFPAGLIDSRQER